LRRLKAIAPEVQVIIVTGYGDTSSAVQAMKLGAYDYLTKPLQTDQILMAVRRAAERRELGAEIEGLRSQLDATRSLRSLMDPSREVENILRQIRQVADSDFTILIHGKTGTGKGARRAGDPPAELSTHKAFRRTRLWRDSRNADRVRAVRLREGSIHRRESAERRVLPARGGR
jgi:DNA-binding response OmpR family regulator